MKQLILTCLLFVMAGNQWCFSQEKDSLISDPYLLFENVAEQEGMFYLPQSPVRMPVVPPLIYERRLNAAYKNNNQPAVIRIASDLGWIELEKGNYEKAIAYFDSAITAQTSSGSLKAGGVLHLFKGFAQYRNLDYQSALSTFTISLNKLEHQQAKNFIPVAHALIAQSYLVQKDFTNALKAFREANSAFAAIGNLKGVARTEIQIAELEIRKGNFREAEKSLDAAMKYFIETKDLNGQALVYRDRGIIKFRKNEYEAAITEFSNSHALSHQLSVAYLLKNTYLKLYTLKSLMGEHDASNNLNIRYVQLRDSIDNVERSRILNSQLTRRDLLEKESVAEMLRRNNEISYQQLSAQELETNRLITEAEIERLEKEKIIEDLNMAKKISDQSNLEREDRIQQLTREKAMQDLALSQKELQVSRGQALRNTLLTAFAFIIIIAALLFNRYRNQSKSHQQLDKAYQELSETHHKLLAAQEQLIHAQKMASLGQLTAGIAHEIQNPLNFVNNFSELSMELIDELKEPGANQQEILNDLHANLQKINSHGKRADKIVKGMLLHSRAGQAEKQPADINKMIDELLELSYHGNRSRDNSFTAEIIRNFDLNLPQVNVVTQDISRVLINLFNNAFYAVGQKSKSEGRIYKATVGVSTRVSGNNVVIKLRDNGPGIPDEIRKKIFDPFFTTKPAGEGTGLGLSLSYDVIVKGHNGSLVVNSEPGVSTEFIITIPVA
jgi:two-component system, NtrC family, sensor kinase